MVDKQNPSSHPQAEPDHALTAEKIQRQLRRILASAEFQATDQQREFLRFVVSETLAGNTHEIKGYTVATRVFARKGDFDQATDPIVSIQANKLRRALERYYLISGKQDPIRIDLPKGTYVPTFQLQPRGGPDTAVPRVESQDQESTGGWPTVVFQPFKNLTGDAEQDFLVEGLSTELAIELARYQDIVVLIRRMGDEDIHRKPAARFQVKGSVRKDSKLIKLAVQLIDTKTRRQTWADSYQCGHDAAQLIGFHEHVSQVIAAKIAGEHGIISQALSIESRHTPPANLKTYEAILRYYQFDSVLSAENYFRAFEALKHATVIEPGCGQVWSMLARLYSTNCTLEFFNPEETPLEEAVAFAERGVQLDPANQRTRTVLASLRLFTNEISAALAENERALALNPHSLFFMDNIGYLFTLLGDWERGTALIRKAIELNPYYRHFVHYGLWLDWFRQEQYEQAYLETFNLRAPWIFWEPLCRAGTLGMLGRLEEGKQAVEELLKLKPEFSTRARVLIAHYIKFEDIMERFITGLRNVGLQIP